MFLKCNIQNVMLISQHVSLEPPMTAAPNSNHTRMQTSSSSCYQLSHSIKHPHADMPQHADTRRHLDVGWKIFHPGLASSSQGFQPAGRWALANQPEFRWGAPIDPFRWGVPRFSGSTGRNTPSFWARISISRSKTLSIFPKNGACGPNISTRR
jgi:hypothetical protein